MGTVWNAMVECDPERQRDQQKHTWAYPIGVVDLAVVVVVLKFSNAGFEMTFFFGARMGSRSVAASWKVC